MKKLITILIIMLFFTNIVTSTIKAASFLFTPNPNESEVESGDTVTIDLNLSDIDVGELGINTFSCKLQYDETIFENIEITPQNNWSITYNDEKNNEKYGTMLAVLVEVGTSTDQQIGTITLKVKEDVKGKIGQIYFTEVATNDGQNLIQETDKNIKIIVKDDIFQGRLPQTGVYTTIVLIGILIITIIAVVLYFKHQNKKSKA